MLPSYLFQLFKGNNFSSNWSFWKIKWNMTQFLSFGRKRNKSWWRHHGLKWNKSFDYLSFCSFSFLLLMAFLFHLRRWKTWMSDSISTSWLHHRCVRCPYWLKKILLLSPPLQWAFFENSIEYFVLSVSCSSIIVPLHSWV